MVRKCKEVVAPKRTTRSYSSMEKSEGSQNLEHEVGIVKVKDKLHVIPILHVGELDMCVDSFLNRGCVLEYIMPYIGSLL